VVAAYGGRPFKFGPDYLIPKPFDPRVLWWVAPAVAQAAIDSGVARLKLDVAEYRERLMSRSSNAAYSIMRGIGRTARNAPKRIVFPEASNAKLLRALQIVVDEGIARPVLLGRRAEIEAACKDLDLDVAARCEIIDPSASPDAARYADKLFALRQRKGVTLPGARGMIAKSNYYGMMMVNEGDADGLVGGLKLTYPETVRPALQLFGLAPGAKVAVGMYMMVLQNSVKFFGDTVFNIDPDAETLADIAVQLSDAVAGLGVRPRVAMISYSNFGSVRHPEVQKIEEAIDLVRHRRPDLEIDGEMQPELALSAEKRAERYPFSRLTSTANVLVFKSLAAGNAAYQTLKVLGGASAVGPIILGLGKPVSLVQPEDTVDDIVNMTAYTVMKAQQQETRAAEPRRA
jgi:malate dehydrogenase (oxaloacetate-decarboxylating)(NADP+)